ncbi:RsmB/NOP family class I SAM-dependent RNA methyltransferase [Kiloniella antarctica]|uniref:RsmB/NOP family class I SAM-dependent RNA methyltransferase n=1 Tax=Kiloniella antarctica TaxID=1550907 RepID=A0ABW5BQQ7_9PROT
MRPNGRIQTSIELLNEVQESPLPMDRVVNTYLRARRFIGSKDRRDINARVYGVIRSRCRLDWWTTQTGLTAGNRSAVLAYTILVEGMKASELDEICNGEQYSPEKLSDFENEALATLQGKTLDHPDMSQAVMGELPDWISGLFEQQFGKEQAVFEMAALQQEATLDLRVNLLKGDREQAQEFLAADDVISEKTAHSDWGLRVQGRTALGNCKAFREGLVEVQDEGSQLIAILCDAKPGMSIIDLCAGAGGKTLALAASLGNDGDLVAMDVDARRLQRAEPRMERAGVENVRYATLNNDNLNKMAKKGFDRVLVDAPCSGSGTWRRQPDARLRLTKEKYGNYQGLQADVLEKSAKCVKVGGRLIYATCSLFNGENIDQINTFLTKHANYTLRDASKLWVEVSDVPCPFDGEVMKLTPAQHGLDGFFCAVLERTA